MKNANVSKINTLGKVSKVIVILLMIAVIAGIVGTVIGAVTMATLPEDAIQITGTTDAEVVVDESRLSALGSALVKSGTLVDLPDTDIHFDHFGTDFSLNIKETKTDNSHYSYTIDGDITKFNCKAFAIAGTMACLGGTLVLIASLISCIFGKKLTDALSKCQSPFEENVLKRMKAFGFSLIPFAVVSLILKGIGLLTALFALIIILFVFVFNYGAELQRESDETV
ncbi:MAG: hypothetical protein IJ071_04920 [Ruminococcus sp.]|nr:hypothetical protein [Ruminococcus sp.]